MATAPLLDLLMARSGIVCAVGAGGKKSTLYRLFEHHRGRVALTSTVHIPPFPQDLALHVVREKSENLLPAVQEAASVYHRIAYTQRSSKRGRFEGVTPAFVSEIHKQGGFDATYVKADGARTRMIKAPSHDEPQIPPGTTTVIPVVSIRAVNAPLSERVAHRVEQIMGVTGADRDKPFTCSHLARLLVSDRGLLKGVGDSNVVPVINMVDDADARTLGIKIAEEALALTTRFDRIVLASMRNPEPVVQVVDRNS